MTQNEFVGPAESRKEYCLRDTLSARSFYEEHDLQSWIDGEDVQEMSRRVYEEVEEGPSTE